MSKYTDINDWSEYWLNEFKNNREYWVKNGLDDFQFKLVFDSPEKRDAAWKEICDFWDGGGWGEPYDYIDFETSRTVLGVYLTCPETPLIIRIAKNYEGEIYNWNNKFLEKPPQKFPYWIPSDYRLKLYEKKKKQSQKSDSGCYIATAVYGSYDCPEVWTLRRYRDEMLDNTMFGRMFIRCYYAISPTMVKWFGTRDWFKRVCLKPLNRWVSDLNKKGFNNTPYIDKY